MIAHEDIDICSLRKHCTKSFLRKQHRNTLSTSLIKVVAVANGNQRVIHAVTPFQLSSAVRRTLKCIPRRSLPSKPIETHTPMQYSILKQMQTSISHYVMRIWTMYIPMMRISMILTPMTSQNSMSCLLTHVVRQGDQRRGESAVRVSRRS